MNILKIILVVLFSLLFFSACTKENDVEDMSLKNVLESGTLVIGTDATYPPMEYLDENNEIIGFDIDFIKEISSSLNVNPEVKSIEWDNIFNDVKSGEVDVIISSITITTERSEEMLFSDPYFNGGQVIVTLESQEIIFGQEDLREKKVGVQIDTTSQNEAEKYTSLVEVYPDYEQATKDLLSRKIDAIIIDYVAGNEIVKLDNGLKIVGDPLTQEFYGIATKETNYALIEEINSIIRQMKRDGRIDELKDKWFES